MTEREKIVVGLDVDSPRLALRLVRELHDLTAMFKVGSQLYMAAGRVIVEEIVNAGGKVFLDLKFHDIPNTVALAAIEAAKLGVTMMTIHASGGRAMMEAVAGRLSDVFGASKPLAVAVTVLTSLDEHSLREIGVSHSPDDQVRRLALLAEDCGIDGVVCSPREIPLVRGAVRSGFRIVTPGVRLPGQPTHDQQRTSAPSWAIAAGADYIVVARPVVQDPNPRSALERILRECSLGARP